MVVKVVKVVPMGLNTKKFQGVMIKSIVNSRGGGGSTSKKFPQHERYIFLLEKPNGDSTK